MEFQYFVFERFKECVSFRIDQIVLKLSQCSMSWFQKIIIPFIFNELDSLCDCKGFLARWCNLPYKFHRKFLTTHMTSLFDHTHAVIFTKKHYFVLISHQIVITSQIIDIHTSGPPPLFSKNPWYPKNKSLYLVLY